MLYHVTTFKCMSASVVHRADAYSDRQEELDAERKEKYKHWNRRKDEEMRRRLLMAYRPYFPNDVFHTGSGMP